MKKIKKLLSLDLVKVSSTTFISTIVKFISNFISAKVIAVYVGPAGIAIFGQLTNAAAIFLMLASGAINTGITKYLAQHSNEPNVQKKYISNAFLITLYASIFVTIIILLFAKTISFYLFNNDSYLVVTYLLAASIIFSAFNNLFLSIINGFKQYKKFVKISIFSSFFMVLLTIILVKKWEVTGALTAYIAYQSLIIFISYYFIKKEDWIDFNFWKAKLDKKILKNLSKYTLMTLISASVLPICLITIRKILIHYNSIIDAGIWEGLNRISMTYLTLITSSLQVYYLPRLSELQSKDLIKKEIFQAYKLIIPFLLFMCFSIFFLRNQIIIILFSNEFLPMSNLFLFQLVGDFFKIASFLIAFLMWAKGMIKIFILTEILFSGFYIAASYFGLKYWGLDGVVKAYALNYFLYFIFFIVYFKKILIASKPNNLV